MSKILKHCLAGAFALGLPWVAPAAEVDPVAKVGDGLTPVAGPVSPPTPVGTRLSMMGAVPLDLQRLAQKRGGADVFNDMQLRGVVADNRAVNVSTGSNLITEGAFSGASGVPMVVQNSGNNVLIQSATILNIQVK